MSQDAPGELLQVSWGDDRESFWDSGEAKVVLDEHSLKYSVDTVLPKLGPVLQALFKEEQKKRPEEVPYHRLLLGMFGDPYTQECILMGAFAILRGMGLIYIDTNGRVKGISRHACYVLGSLGKFLSASVPAADEVVCDKERDYLIILTKALESARMENVQVDHEPLHSRRIVNVLIKSRQIRHWMPQDVYLHVYHRQWKEYHLVGLSYKDDSKTDEEIAQLALEKQVGLEPDQYVLDPAFNPPEVTDKRISATSGALTEYTYCLRVVKEVLIKPRLQRLIKENKFDRDWFRWFTWEEMKERKSEQGEPIMFSIATVMKQEDLGAIPVVSADDVHHPTGDLNILSYLSYRVTKNQLLALAGILLALALLIRLVIYMVSPLDRSNQLLDNLANIADITSGLLALVGALSGGISIALHRRS
jgi:hypothetical protein